MTKIFCDICGKEINNLREMSQYKMKKLELSFFPEFRWEHLTVHKNCWRDLAELIAERRTK